jgi:type II secretory pathway predicted ATPase ExeA
MVPGYESAFGLVARPFSLAPDPHFFFRNGGAGRALDALVAGLGRREPFLLVTGDLGVGKTLLGRTLAAEQRDHRPVAFVRNPLVTPDALLRMLVEDLGGSPAGWPPDSPGADPLRLLATTMAAAHEAGSPAILVIDDAHRMPAATRDALLDLATPEPGPDAALHVVLLAQPPAHAPLTLGNGLDDRVKTRARLVSMSREESAEYVAHRLRLAGASGAPIFSSRALDVLFGLSNGLPRLVNLLCERALQEAAAHAQPTIEPGHIAAAASALKLTHARPRRFRWFSRKIS